MKAVMISVQPKFCEKIASGECTILVKRTRPKLEPPFKCYIYMTAGYASYPVEINGAPYICHNNGGMDVIGEFVCDKIDEYPYKHCTDGEHLIPYDDFEKLGMDGGELYDYLRVNDGYGWHISDLKIYDKPKELKEFTVRRKCNSCDNGYGSSACIYDEDCKVQTALKRPFQSWGYVEELKK